MTQPLPLSARAYLAALEARPGRALEALPPRPRPAPLARVLADLEAAQGGHA